LENNTIKTGKITLKQQGKIPKKMGKTHLKKIGKHNFFFVKLQGQHLVLSAASQIIFERVSHSRKKRPKNGIKLICFWKTQPKNVGKLQGQHLVLSAAPQFILEQVSHFRKKSITAQFIRHGAFTIAAPPSVRWITHIVNISTARRRIRARR